MELQPRERTTLTALVITGAGLLPLRSRACEHSIAEQVTPIGETESKVLGTKGVIEQNDREPFDTEQLQAGEAAITPRNHLLSETIFMELQLHERTTLTALLITGARLLPLRSRGCAHSIAEQVTPIGETEFKGRGTHERNRETDARRAALVG